MPRRTTAVSRTVPASPEVTGLRPEPALTRDVRCPACGSRRVTRISMTLTDGTPVDFSSCQECEHRSWREVTGDILALPGVLDRARKVR